MPTCLKCNTEFPTWVMIEGKSRNLCNRKFCLECSPFNSHNTRNIVVSNNETRICPRCERELPIDKFYRRRKTNTSPYCGECSTNYQMYQLRQRKIWAVNQKGGACEQCGYNRYIGALEFHHINPHEKEFKISQAVSRLPKSVLLEELRKCSLLCANCHREAHAILNGLLKVSPTGFEPA